MDSPIQSVVRSWDYSQMRPIKSIPALTLLILLLSFLPISGTVAEPGNSNIIYFGKGDCGLTVEDPHISDSLLKKN